MNGGTYSIGETRGLPAQGDSRNATRVATRLD